MVMSMTGFGRAEMSVGSRDTTATLSSHAAQAEDTAFSRTS